MAIKITNWSWLAQVNHEWSPEPIILGKFRTKKAAEKAEQKFLKNIKKLETVTLESLKIYYEG